MQIAHLYCNLQKNGFSASTGFCRPEYARARLLSLIEGIPMPEEIHRGCFPAWAFPASRQVEFMTAVFIAAGVVAADPRYGDPGSRVWRAA